MAATAVVLHRGPKVFWKVRCTVEVVIVNHGVHDVLEVICFEPALSHEAARLYLRHSALLREVAKEDILLEEITEKVDAGHERKLNLLVNFITERLQIKLFNPKTRLFQIEFQQQQLTESISEKETTMECTRPFYLEPFAIYPGVVSKDIAHKKDATSPSNRSDTSCTTLSMSRSRDEAQSAHDGVSVYSHSTDYVHGIASGSDDHTHNLHNPHSSAHSSTTTGNKRGITLDLNDTSHVSTSARNRLPFSRSHTRTTPATIHATRSNVGNNAPSVTNSAQPSPTVTPRMSPSTTPRVQVAPRTYTHARRRSSMHIGHGNVIHAQQVATASASIATHHAVGSHHSTQHAANPHVHYTIHTNHSHSHSPKGNHSAQSSFAALDAAHNNHTPRHNDHSHAHTYTTHPTNPPTHCLALTPHAAPLHHKTKPKFVHKETYYTRTVNSVSTMFSTVCSVSICGGSSAIHSVASHNDTKVIAVGRKYSVGTAKDSSEHDSSTSH